MAALLYGFTNMADILNQRAIEVPQDSLITAINDTLAAHNSEMDRLLSLFSEDTTDYQLSFKGQVVTRSQPLDENGRALPIKGANAYNAAWPIFSSGNAWGANYVARQKMTVQQLNDITSAILSGDFRRTRDDLLAALFNSTSGGRAFNDPIVGALSVQGLANGDSTLYVKTGTSQDVAASDTHYLAQADAIEDAHNPFGTIRDELVEHPVNSAGEIITFISSTLVASAEDLTNFVGFADTALIVPDTQVRIGSTLTTALPANAKLLGRVNQQWIVEWPSLPSGYIVSVVSSGTPPLRRRQDPETQLQGFKPVAQREDFPYFDEQWFRRQGFGGWNRVGAVAMFIGSSTWAIPSGYDAFVP